MAHSVSLKAQLSKGQVWVRVFSSQEATTVSIADVQRLIQHHFRLGTCKVLGWPKVKAPILLASASASASAASATSAASSAASSVGGDAETTALITYAAPKTIVLRVIGQQMSLDTLQAAEEVQWKVKLDTDARTEFDEQRRKEQDKQLVQLREQNLHQRNRISVKGDGGAQSIVHHQILTLNDYCIMGNYVDGEKHIRLSAALQECLHEQQQALRLCATSGCLPLLRTLLEHSARSAATRKKLTVQMVSPPRHSGRDDCVFGSACSYGRVHIVQYLVETHDYVADYKRQLDLYEHRYGAPPAAAEAAAAAGDYVDEQEVAQKLRRDAHEAWRACLVEGLLIAARHCHLLVVRYLLSILSKMHALTPSLLTGTAEAAAKHGDVWIVKDCLTKWPMEREALESSMAMVLPATITTSTPPRSLRPVPKEISADPYRCLEAAINAKQFRVFEYLIQIEGINVRYGGLVKTAVSSGNLQVLRYLVQVLHFTPDEMKMAVYVTVQVETTEERLVVDVAPEEASSTSASSAAAAAAQLLVGQEEQKEGVDLEEEEEEEEEEKEDEDVPMESPRPGGTIAVEAQVSELASVAVIANGDTTSSVVKPRMEVIRVQTPRRMLKSCSITHAIDHLRYHQDPLVRLQTIECLLSDCKVLLTPDDIETMEYALSPLYTNWRAYKADLQQAQYAREVKETKAAGIAGALSGRLQDIETLSAVGGNILDFSVDASILAHHRDPVGADATSSSSATASSSSSSTSTSQATTGSYVESNEFLFYPLDLSRMMAHQITGSLGLHHRRYEAEGDTMFGKGWKTAFLERERARLVQVRKEERLRAAREREHTTRNVFRLSDVSFPDENAAAASAFSASSSSASTRGGGGGDRNGNPHMQDE